ncbi:hypothetical protein AB4Y64_17595 [Lysobacter sp. TAF61]|uniref:hypothetical protein n=1 Tax=Lysobacter sp. TAF61 TaxID=3233072 RepID=UPI003F99A05C
MRQFAALTTAAALVMVCPAAHACLGGKRTPEIEDTGRYSEIRVVEVTGVQLTEYEDYQLMRRGVRPWPKPQGGIEFVYPTSSTPGFEVQALVDRTIKGPATPTARFTLGGCGVEPPKLHDRGVIFVEPGTGYAVAVWQSEGEHYRKLATALGMEITGEP